MSKSHPSLVCSLIKATTTSQVGAKDCYVFPPSHSRTVGNSIRRSEVCLHELTDALDWPRAVIDVRVQCTSHPSLCESLANQLSSGPKLVIFTVAPLWALMHIVFIPTHSQAILMSNQSVFKSVWICVLDYIKQISLNCCTFRSHWLRQRRS